MLTVMGCFITCLLLLALGSKSLITLGLTIVDTIRKNSIRKNMMSFIELVSTWEDRRRRRERFTFLSYELEVMSYEFGL